MDIKTKNILVVGLGSMGFGIAQSLIRAGYIVYGQDKNLKQLKRLIEEGGYDKNIPFNVYFNYVEGLTNGSDVEISGIKVGEVTNINLLNNQVLVSGFIDKTYDIPEDSIAIIRSNGIFGKKTFRKII